MTQRGVLGPTGERRAIAMDETPWEESPIERKIHSDLKDLLKTLVTSPNPCLVCHWLLTTRNNTGHVPGALACVRKVGNCRQRTGHAAPKRDSILRNTSGS